MRIILVVGMALGFGWFGLRAEAEEPATPAPPPPSPSPDTTAPAERPRAPIKNLFLPVVRKEPAKDGQDTAPVVSHSPLPENPEKPEDFMFITGIVRHGEQKQVLVEDRRTGQASYLKKGDALGEGVIVEIAAYHVTVKEWTVMRRIPLGYSVSGKKDMYVPVPTKPSAASPRPGNPPAASTVTVPRWPDRTQWAQWTPEQRKEYLQRRREAFNRRRGQRRPR